MVGAKSALEVGELLALSGPGSRRLQISLALRSQSVAVGLITRIMSLCAIVDALPGSILPIR